MEILRLRERYRCERRKLLDFLLSTSLIKEFRTPSDDVDLSGVDLDTISADYVLDCIRSVLFLGRKLDISEATKKYYDELGYPAMINSPSGSSYLLISDPLFSGSPPQRVPPQIDLNPRTSYSSCSLNQSSTSVVEEIKNSEEENEVRRTAAETASCEPRNDAVLPSLGFPVLSTGLSDDDLRETAYEIFIASVILSGVHVYSFEDKKREKKTRIFSRLRSRREKVNSQPQSTNDHSDLLDIMRVQMQISEAMNTLIWRRLTEFTSRTCEHIDIPQISLELLSGICKYDFHNEKSFIQWKKRQANILEEVLYHSVSPITAEHVAIRSSLKKIRDSEEWNIRMYPSENADVLLVIKSFASKLSSAPVRFGIQGETYNWTGGYHLNLKLYETLLSSVFDILEEGQLIEEADEILALIKLTWSTLGITQKMHHLLYGWVLSQKFVETGDLQFLEYATSELQKVLASEDGRKEAAYLDSLICSIVINGRKLDHSLLDAVFVSISIWCDRKLQDYHLHFSEKPIFFGRVVTLITLVGVPTADESGDIKLTRADTEAVSEMTSMHFKGYVENSIQAAYKRALKAIDRKSETEKRHPLAVLADDLKMIVERQSTVFNPVLLHWCPAAGIISSTLLHQLYGDKLKPFLEKVSFLSEDVRSVLPAADMLERELIQLYYCAHGEDRSPSHVTKDLNPYEIGEVSGPVILDWMDAQNEHILQWTERAFHLEDWEPLSFQQRQAASIIEVFRILEEAVDQFFSLKIPMDVIHLQSLLCVISQSLETYLSKVINQSVEKNHLFPAAPALTRHTETLISIIKKKPVDCAFLTEEVLNKLNNLSISKLCVILNTLQYIQSQIAMLEDGIRQSWAHVRLCSDNRWKREHLRRPLTEGLLWCSESVDELFSTFNSIRRTVVDAINRFCDFAGARVVFWDLRDTFLFLLYRGNVETARLESVLPQLDTALDQICALIADTLRDSVVLSVCRASLEGYVWVLLDGGPSRVFSEDDIQMLQEDLNMLKDFFVADGEGLPQAVVEKEAYLALQIMKLYSLNTETVIGMLMSASEQISMGLDCSKPGTRHLEDAHTLLRVLCHKKDKEASKFLKRQYQLPKSSEYDDTQLNESSSVSPLVSDLFKRSASINWTSKRSFKSIKKKLKDATSEIKPAAW
ncbi:protein unc-13 homolog [Macadamia integrifolia]|uniref:protein unc-13 homolog n=1 Tax=Macadamia integrifolia TaxID=60698 RepID=UPI001C500D32|nr:protein unc-13 homolog [Macadamia integrifolia]